MRRRGPVFLVFISFCFWLPTQHSQPPLLLSSCQLSHNRCRKADLPFGCIILGRRAAITRTTPGQRDGQKNVVCSQMSLASRQKNSWADVNVSWSLILLHRPFHLVVVVVVIIVIVTLPGFSSLLICVVFLCYRACFSLEFPSPSLASSWLASASESTLQGSRSGPSWNACLCPVSSLPHPTPLFSVPYHCTGCLRCIL